MRSDPTSGRSAARFTRPEELAIRSHARRQKSAALDKGHGSCFLRDPRIASIVANAITHFDEVRYRLLAWCVMPNHAHIAAVLDHGWPVDRVVHGWKSFTSRFANAQLRRAGAFWQEDYWDHCVRNGEELERVITYVVNNPVAAGLCDWRFVASYPDRIAELLR